MSTYIATYKLADASITYAPSAGFESRYLNFRRRRTVTAGRWLTKARCFAISSLGGRIAQLAEQLTLNQRVAGSSPAAPTNKIKGLDDFI